MAVSIFLGVLFLALGYASFSSFRKRPEDPGRQMMFSTIRWGGVGNMVLGALLILFGLLALVF